MGLLAGVRVVDLTDGTLSTGRILADLGADVLLVEPAGGATARRDRLAFLAWNAGKRSVVAALDDPMLADILRRAHVVLARRGPGPDEAPQAVWVAITTYGLEGPRAR